MRFIPLTDDQFSIVDDEDFDMVTQYAWSARKAPKTYYAIRQCGGRTIFMHRLILGLEGEERIDHRDGDGLNNQKYNLRIATKSQNAANQGLPKNNTSGFKGVYWHKKAGKWMASIMFHDEAIYLGLFSNKDDAARAYDVAARHHFGEFARTNFQ